MKFRGIIRSLALIFTSFVAVEPIAAASSEKSPDETNPVLKTIEERRSIRRFKEADVPNQVIQQLLEAATWAPSSNNDQPWKFVVVKNNETKQQVLRAVERRLSGYFESRGVALDRMKNYWSNIFSAPVHIFAFCDTSGVDIEDEWRDIEMLWCMQSVTIACQNILLAAKALDLGSLWIGLTLAAEDDIKRILDVPEGMELATTIAVGYPDESPVPRPRKPVEEVTFFESWQRK
ncbi:MAG: nitroreductase [Candidatus Latescibacteria bacterium]|nr:nitroreductase [Candidatus Latescibacterota bacterium]NIO29017.1 nitroreductase [Candidatus Latescibacterota bacterium]NIO56642.1 nitroreductase [Candidatus Latescibacterota bacterium]NIT02225.1 nitroreductase [Candidatus Latescibacterota bacterium]NIT39110.1 nitroreductase [Candidatus Latescibacterota bacterium]